MLSFYSLHVKNALIQSVPLPTIPDISLIIPKTNKDILTRFEQGYVRCVRNEEECVCSVCLFRFNIFIGFRIIKEMPGLVGSGTPYIMAWPKLSHHCNPSSFIHHSLEFATCSSV